MKSNIYVILAMISIVVISCSKENNENGNRNQLLNRQPTQNTTVDRVLIGNQIWATQNLNVTRYRNGDIIPQVTDPTEWGNLTTGAWCYYNNNPNNSRMYGKLYNCFAVNDPRGLAPVGWHIASRNEWIELQSNGLPEFYFYSPIWYNPGPNSPNAPYINITGFSALPNGLRGENGQYLYYGESAFWWFKDSFFPPDVPDSGYIKMGGGNFFIGISPKEEGFSVRCIKD